MDKISGVYKITNTITGDFYIGSSCNIMRRWACHKCVSYWRAQPNSKLYKDMAESSLDNFKFEVIEETADLKEREQYWIEHLKPSYNKRRADGIDIEGYKETNRQCCKAWYEAHREEKLAKKRDSRSRLCLYEGETITLGALIMRLSRTGIAHSTLEAKKYLISNHCRPNTPSQ